MDDDSGRRFITAHLTPRHVAAYDRCGHPAMRCDYFRMCYLVLRGGLYIDADEFFRGGDCERLVADGLLKVQPLCYDNSTGEMVSVSTFMHGEPDSPDWIYYVNNNPVVAPPGHPLLMSALARSTELLESGSGAVLGIQSTAGPGNLTASLVAHALTRERTGSARDFAFLPEWESLSESRWPLSYRDDVRNWRLWESRA